VAWCLPVIEVEVKAWVKDRRTFEDLPRRIAQLGVLEEKSYTQRDIYFAHPSRNFLLTDEALRIRIEDGKCEMTYKGPKIDKLSKTRVEITLKVDNCEKAIEFLRRLGFSEVMEVVKERRVFKVPYKGREVKVSLDEVKNLGTFIELECTVDNEEKIPHARDDLLSLLECLGISKEMTERRSYLELLLFSEEAANHNVTN